MAIQTGLMTFTGKMGNVIGYRRNGKYCFRSAPASVRQTSATRKAARNFGEASRKGKLIRHGLQNELEVRVDGTLVNRLNKALILADLRNFRFNKHTSLDQLFTLQPVLEKGQIHIPAQSIHCSSSTTHIKIKAIALHVDFAKRRIIRTITDSHMVDIRQPFAGTTLQAPVADDTTTIVVLQVSAYQSENGKMVLLGNRKFCAADILSVISPTPLKAKKVKKNKKPEIKKVLSPASFQRTKTLVAVNSSPPVN
jgi:hypothetical protein